MTGTTGANAEFAGAGGYSRTDLMRLLEKSPRSQRVQLIGERVRRLVGLEGHPWMAELALIADEQHLSVPELRALTSDLGWASRDAGDAVPVEDMRPGCPVDLDLFRLIVVYTRGQRLRFDFRFRQLHECAHTWLSEYDDALIRAFAAYAAFGLRQPDALNLYKQSIDALDADQVSRHVCLDGLWMAQHLPEQAGLLLDLSGYMIGRGEGGGNLYFRRARAFSRLGQTEKALDDVYRAIDMLPAGNNAIHQDYVREMQIIATRADLEDAGTRLMERIREEVKETTQQEVADATRVMGERIKSAERLVGDGLLKVVEILGLFVTLAAFVVGGGFAMLKSQDWWQVTGSAALIGVGSLTFFALLRLIMRWRKD